MAKTEPEKTEIAAAAEQKKVAESAPATNNDTEEKMEVDGENDTEVKMEGVKEVTNETGKLLFMLIITRNSICLWYLLYSYMILYRNCHKYN